ncbi:MAG: hypothetical protein A2Y33_11035 [Spirochaetes bacterium GWF1_51_8]|nr:MAG: hypothetical protein A2Y33_11035 [Spirochaetes bacterium GWF1_51_8]
MGIKHFDKFFAVAEKLALKKKKNIEELDVIGRRLLEDYKACGHIVMMPHDILKIDNYSFIPLLKHLLEKAGNPDKILSPVEGQADSSWMADSSFCFINIRGTGISPSVHGDFINAAKLLPALRVDAIHLAPFFECALEIIYGVDSVTVIDENTLNPDFLKAGMKADDQVRFFTDVAHLLKMTVGFDIEPHTSQFSRIAIEHPEYFRWLKLSKSREELDGKLTQKEMLTEKEQVKIREQVKTHRDKVLKKYGLKNLEQPGKDPETKKAHYETIDELIAAGIWTIPSHTWKGAGLPEYSHYVEDQEFPEFKYLSTDGEDHREHAFGTLTPFRFYDNIPLNRVPKETEAPVPNEETIKYFTGIFPALYKKFRFDYLRFDYVDHVWDSIIDKAGKFPISDRITPYVLKKTISKARSGGKKYIGAMAERMGTDINIYKKVGFDLLLGDDILRPINLSLIKDTLRLNKKIEKLNSKKGRKVNIQFAVDTHDSGHPLFNATPMLLYGAKGVGLRMFIARFSGWGSAIRSKYELIGNHDGTTGLYLANNKNVSVEWKSDKEMNDMYHHLEDTYARLLPRLKKAEFVSFTPIQRKAAYWTMKDDEGLMVFVVNLTQHANVPAVLIKEVKIFKSAKIINPFTAQHRMMSHLLINELQPHECRIILIQV